MKRRGKSFTKIYVKRGRKLSYKGIISYRAFPMWFNFYRFLIAKILISKEILLKSSFIKKKN